MRYLALLASLTLTSACRYGFDYDLQEVPLPDPDTEDECGDGLIAATETCDDRNTEDGDGCSEQCTTERGFRCTGEPSTCDVAVQLQGGTDNIPDTATTITVPLSPPVDPGHSVLFFNVTHTGTDPDNSQVTGYLNDAGDALVFERPNTTPDVVTIDIAWSVVESSELIVQRGRTVMTMAGTTENVALPTPVTDTAQAFALATARVPGNNFAWNDWALVRLPDPTTLQIDRTPGTCCDATVDWQVVEFGPDTDAWVQGGDVQFGETVTAIPVTLPQAAPMDRSFMVFTQNSLTSGIPSAAANAIRGEFLSDTELVFERESGAGVIDVSWFVATWDRIRVQHGTAAFPVDAFQQIIALDTRFDPDLSVSLLPGMMRQGSTPYTADSRLGLCWFTTRVQNDGTELLIRRADAGDVGTASYAVIEFQ